MRRFGTSGFGNELDVDCPWIQSLPTSLWKKSQAAGDDGRRWSNDGELWGNGWFLWKVLTTAPAGLADRK